MNGHVPAEEKDQEVKPFIHRCDACCGGDDGHRHACGLHSLLYRPWAHQVLLQSPGA